MDAGQFQLSNYTLAELRALKDQIARQIIASERDAVDDARRRIAQIAQQAGIALQDLFKKPKKTNKSSVVYVNPDDDTQTWSGRGRQPAWVKTWLDCGITLEELRRT